MKFGQRKEHMPKPYSILSTGRNKKLMNAVGKRIRRAGQNMKIETKEF
jgi:hypothetical protein